MRWCVAAGELDETQVTGAEEGPTSRPRDGERRGTRMCVERLGTGSCGNGHLIIRRVTRLCGGSKKRQKGGGKKGTGKISTMGKHF